MCTVIHNIKYTKLNRIIYVLYIGIHIYTDIYRRGSTWHIYDTSEWRWRVKPSLHNGLQWRDKFDISCRIIKSEISEIISTFEPFDWIYYGESTDRDLLWPGHMLARSRVVRVNQDGRDIYVHIWPYRAPLCLVCQFIVIIFDIILLFIIFSIFFLFFIIFIIFLYYFFLFFFFKGKKLWYK